jgi:hypothetical protein
MKKNLKKDFKYTFSPSFLTFISKHQYVSLLSKDLSLLCVGDAFIARRIGVYSNQHDIMPLFKRVIDADVAFINLEIAIHNFEGYPIGEGKSDAYGQADPIVADDLKGLGFDLCSQANNHAMDYSAGGLEATINNLNRVGLVHAGAGKNLAEAREAAYLDTPCGVVSLISASTHNLGVASHARKDVPGRPGINPLRFSTLYHLKTEQYTQFLTILKQIDVIRESEKEPISVRFPNRETRFTKGNENKRELIPNKTDLEGNLKAVKDSRKLSDWSLFSLHDHQSGVRAPAEYRNLELPPDEVRDFAHKVIDAGADIYIGHGPHILRGIEIYHGKPIFYSLGNFVFQSTLIRRQPGDLFDQWELTTDNSTPELYEKREAPPAVFFEDPAYWESVVAEVDFREGKLKAIRLIPIILDYNKSKPLSEQRTHAGVPRLATGEKAENIIQKISHLSKLYGTAIEYKEGLGIISQI